MEGKKLIANKVIKAIHVIIVNKVVNPPAFTSGPNNQTAIELILNDTAKRIPIILERIESLTYCANMASVNGIAPKVLSVISLKISVCLAAFATELEILNVLFDRPTISSCDPVSEILILHSSVKSLILKLPLCLSFCPVFGIALPGTVH